MLLKIGSRGAQIKQVQEMIKACGFKIATDGDFGPATEKLVKAVQKSLGLQDDGIVGPLTFKYLEMWAPHKARGIKVSLYFYDTDFDCNDGSGMVRIHRKLLLLLDKMVVNTGTKPVINSGYRSPAYNKKVGGAENSYHLRGMAADTMFRKKSPTAISIVARQCGAGGVGVYHSFTHVDVGPRRSWLG